MTSSNGALPELHVEHVTKSFGAAAVLRDVSLEIPRGQRVAVIGASGSGKTTLLRMLAGIVAPSDGRVTVFGHETTSLRGRRLREVRRDIGFMHQSDNLVPGLRVVHNVAVGRLGEWSLPRALWSLLVPSDVDAVRAALRRVEVEEKLWALPGTLSGGEQQRVALARLLLQAPRVVLADEPVSALDVRLGREVVRLLMELARDDQRTLVVSLHALEMLGMGFDRIVALRDGRVAWDGTPDDVDAAMLRGVYGAEYDELHLDEVELSPR